MNVYSCGTVITNAELEVIEALIARHCAVDVVLICTPRWWNVSLRRPRKFPAD
jgi:hypothetical protein